MEKIIALAYTNPLHPLAFGGISAVIRHFKGHASEETVRNALSKTPAYTRKKAHKKIKNRVPILVYFKRELFQIDLIEVGYMSKKNSGIRYLLSIIDSASRFAWVIPLKNKKAEHVAAKFDEFIGALDRPPARCHSDRGNEFRGDFKKVLDKHNIKQTFPLTSAHAPTVERFNQSIQGILYRYLKSEGSGRYIDQLDNLVSIYNRRVHSSIKPMTPEEADMDDNKSALARRLLKNYSKFFLKSKKAGRQSLAQGDRVLISRDKKTFHRGYNDQFNEEVYIIDSVNTDKVLPLYRLRLEAEDEVLEGYFYKEELQKLGDGKPLPSIPEYNVIERKDINGIPAAFISWKDLPEKFNSWHPVNMLS
jgi:hypothetical protein